jgi:ABC-type amino acid transport substrate-binding protein
MEHSQMNKATGIQGETRAHRTAQRAVTAIGVVAVLLAACASRSGPKPTVAPARQELRVGMWPDYPPLVFKQDGKITGVEPQFAQELGPALNARITVVETPWEDLIPALRDHRIDIIMSGMSITDERKRLVSFVHPYLRVGQVMVLRRTDASRLRGAAVDQPTTRIGFVTGTTGEAYVRGHFQRAHQQGFDSVDAAVAALRRGRIDIFVHDSPAIWRITAPQNDPEDQLVGRYQPLTREYLAWAVRKDDNALRARLNAVLSKWNRDGELDAILGKWIKVRRTPAAPH